MWVNYSDDENTATKRSGHRWASKYSGHRATPLWQPVVAINSTLYHCTLYTVEEAINSTLYTVVGAINSTASPTRFSNFRKKHFCSSQF